MGLGFSDVELMLWVIRWSTFFHLIDYSALITQNTAANDRQPSISADEPYFAHHQTALPPQASEGKMDMNNFGDIQCVALSIRGGDQHCRGYLSA